MASPTSLSALAVARRIAERLDEDALPYGIGGALALGAWGAPRATKDVDLTIFITERELPRAFDALERAGVLIDRIAATRDVGQMGMFKGRSGRLFVDVFVTGHPQYEDMKRRCVWIDDPASGRKLSFISAEDLCLHKLLYARPKDLIDLEQLVARRPALDFAYVRGWLEQMVPVADPRLRTLDDLQRRFAVNP